jgi:hypothetical protein
MEFGVQATLGAANEASTPPFLSLKKANKQIT